MPGNKNLCMVYVNHWAMELGGAEYSLLDLLEESVKRTKVHLITSETGRLVDRANALGVQCIIIPCSTRLKMVKRGELAGLSLKYWSALLSYFLFVIKAGRKIAEIQPFVVHANIPKSHMALLLLQRFGYPGTVVYHIREIFNRPSLPYTLYSLLFTGNNSNIIAISSAVQMSLPPAMRIRSEMAYNGVTIHEPKKGAVTDPPRFLYCGRVVPWKGCHLLIEAFSIAVIHRGPLAGSLDIVGETIYWDKIYRYELEALIVAHGLGRLCRLLPHTENPATYMLEHNVFCMASDNEPFGRVAAEAHGCGMPVIAFDGGGITEIVEHEVTGIVVPFGDTELFASAMCRFIDSPELIMKYGTAGRERAKRLFDRSVNTARIVDIILGKKKN